MTIKVTPDYTDLLNQAVAREIQVAIQYIFQHAKMEKLKVREIPENILLDKTVYDVVGKILQELSIVEMKHAAKIMERIYYLGGEATTEAKQPVIGNSISEFAKLGVQAEEEALSLYRIIINKAAGLGDWETREISRKSTATKKTTSSNSKNTRHSKMSQSIQLRLLCPSGAKSSPMTTLPC
jgi:bacterioferritin